MAKKRSPKVAQRWEQASAELERAKKTEPEDLRFSLEKAEGDINLPSYASLVPEEESRARFIVKTAPTSKAERPRAHTIAYNSADKELLIVFSSGVCCKYSNVTSDMWLALSNGESTNDFVNGPLSGWGYEYCDRSELSQEVNARIDYTTEKSSRIQKGRSYS